MSDIVTTHQLSSATATDRSFTTWTCGFPRASCTGSWDPTAPANRPR